MTKTGRVIQSTGKWYKVAVNSNIFDCRLPGKFRLEEKKTTNPIAVGDLVDIEIGKDGTGSIFNIHQRRNYIPRVSTRQKHSEQILVANVDQAWVVQSVRLPRIKTGFIDRFLVACEAYEIPGGIIFNKMDLANKKDLDQIEYLTELYTNIGYKVIQTTILKKSSIENLNKLIAGKLSVFIGQSGVGKSSIINTIDPSMKLPVGEISKSTQKGRHTTTFARLIELSNAGYIIDTPGIREFGVVNIEPTELSLFFPEMLSPRENCKFYNCTHSHEPGCGVMKAVEMGDVDAGRYQSYLSILEELEK
ncbi:MAG: ribosome small subunit-dependent GTPase A [Balneolaceae bacterium]